MTVASYISPKAVKGDPSGIEGRGLFAAEPIRAGEVVAVKGGHVIDAATLAGLSEHLRNSEIQIADGLYVAATTDEEYEAVMLFLNHSCEPNVGVSGNVVFVAMHDVEAGEELTVDYAMFDDADDEMRCRCGRRTCRRIVTGRDWQRAELQQRYGRYFSAYLQERMRRGLGDR